MQLDIKCAFHNGKLSGLVYVVQPGDLGDNSGRVWRLEKALYGLKQAARERHKVLVQLLHDLDFDRCHSDPALFIRKYGRCTIFIWFDDLLVFTTAAVMETLCWGRIKAAGAARPCMRSSSAVHGSPPAHAWQSTSAWPCSATPAPTWPF